MFVPGQIIRRRELHALYGGQEQGGISTPANHPYIMLFTAPSGLSHGYEDGWTESSIFLYTGEGQLGDMSFVRGNRSLRDHLQDGKDVYLFESVDRGLVRCVGQMMVIGFHERKGTDSAGNQRNSIVFELIPVEDATQATVDASDSDGATLSELPENELRRIAETSPNVEATPEEKQDNSRRRSKALREYVMRRASGTCEGCGNKAPFVTVRGVPYLEMHYLRRRSDVGPESPTWVAALCPNCHRRVHCGGDAVAYNEQIVHGIVER